MYELDDRDRRDGLGLRAGPPDPRWRGQRRLAQRVADAGAGDEPRPARRPSGPRGSCSRPCRRGGARSRPRFRPSPKTAGAPLRPRRATDWEVVHDVLARALAAFACARRSTSASTRPRVVRREYSMTAEVDRADPASASARGRHVSTITRPNGVTQGSSDVFVQATATHFHVTIGLELGSTAPRTTRRAGPSRSRGCSCDLATLAGDPRRAGGRRGSSTSSACRAAPSSSTTTSPTTRGSAPCSCGTRRRRCSWRWRTRASPARSGSCTRARARDGQPPAGAARGACACSPLVSLVSGAGSQPRRHGRVSGDAVARARPAGEQVGGPARTGRPAPAGRWSGRSALPATASPGRSTWRSRATSPATDAEIPPYRPPLRDLRPAGSPGLVERAAALLGAAADVP